LSGNLRGLCVLFPFILHRFWWLFIGEANGSMRQKAFQIFKLCNFLFNQVVPQATSSL